MLNWVLYRCLYAYGCLIGCYIGAYIHMGAGAFIGNDFSLFDTWHMYIGILEQKGVKKFQ